MRRATSIAPRKRKCSEVRRQQIAEAALRIIAARGLNKLTSVELAREVGITDGTIFRHFNDKAEIVSAAIDLLLRLLSQHFPPPASMPALDRLQYFVLARMRDVEARPNLWALVFSDRLAEAVGERGLAPIAELLLRTRSFVEDCLRAAQKEGAIHPGLAVRPLALTVIGAMHAAAAAHKLAPNEEYPPELVWHTLKDLLCISRAPSLAHAAPLRAEEFPT